MSEVILQVTDLTKIFTARRGIFGRGSIKNVAVDGVSFSIKKGETLGLVGASGCGKSTLGFTIMRLYEANGGRILFDGKDITNSDERALKQIRKGMQIIFQEPFASLDPRLTVEQIISEPLEIHNIGTKASRTKTAAVMLEKVGLSSKDLRLFPSEFSGGQQQRISIARALALVPSLIICDEPISALDVSVQAQVLNLLRDLQDELGLSYLFISHNIVVTAFMSRRIGVMYLGKLVEIGTNHQITEAPRHPYTQMLLAAISRSDQSPQSGSEITRKGEIDEITKRPTGCVFRLSCPIAEEICITDEPQLREIDENREVACHFAGQD